MKKPKHWVWYEVKVKNVSSKLDGGKKSPDNYVNCVFLCRAVLKDAAGKAEEDFSTAIQSTYTVKQAAAKVVDVTRKGAK